MMRVQFYIDASQQRLLEALCEQRAMTPMDLFRSLLEGQRDERRLHGWRNLHSPEAEQRQQRIARLEAELATLKG